MVAPTPGTADARPPAPNASQVPPARLVRQGDMVYLANSQIKLGINLRRGGSITYLFRATDSLSVINDFDLGRQVQASYYSGPHPFGHPDMPYRNWGWNPVGSGDIRFHPAPVATWDFKDGTFHTRSVPLQWALNGVPCDCTFESWLRLDRNRVVLRHRLVNARTDKTQYPAEQQELPAVYVTGRLRRLMTYSGTRPFSGAPPIERPAGFPWADWTATEGWSAFVNAKGWGLGVVSPDARSFLGGYFGPRQDGGPRDSQTGYIAPILREILDHDIVHDYSVTLVLGTIAEIRAAATAINHADPRPDFHFMRDRQHWYYTGAGDDGWPIRAGLRIRTDGADPQINSPVHPFPAAGTPVLHIRAAFTGPETTAQLFWSTFTDRNLSERNSLRFTVRPDGVMRDYALDLRTVPGWTGLIGGLRFDPPGGTGSRVRLCAISWRPRSC